MANRLVGSLRKKQLNMYGFGRRHELYQIDLRLVTNTFTLDLPVTE